MIMPLRGAGQVPRGFLTYPRPISQKNQKTPTNITSVLSTK